MVCARDTGASASLSVPWSNDAPRSVSFSKTPADTSVASQLVSIYRAHGLGGWYAGMSAGLLRAFLANGGGMAAYMMIQQQFSKNAGGPSKSEL